MDVILSVIMIEIAANLLTTNLGEEEGAEMCYKVMERVI